VLGHFLARNPDKPITLLILENKEQEYDLLQNMTLLKTNNLQYKP
jgi:hypothetical protein